MHQHTAKQSRRADTLAQRSFTVLKKRGRLVKKRRMPASLNSSFEFTPGLVNANALLRRASQDAASIAHARRVDAMRRADVGQHTTFLQSLSPRSREALLAGAQRHVTRPSPAPPRQAQQPGGQGRIPGQKQQQQQLRPGTSNSGNRSTAPGSPSPAAAAAQHRQSDSTWHANATHAAAAAAHAPSTQQGPHAAAALQVTVQPDSFQSCGEGSSQLAGPSGRLMVERMESPARQTLHLHEQVRSRALSGQENSSVTISISFHPTSCKALMAWL